MEQETRKPGNGRRDSAAKKNQEILKKLIQKPESHEQAGLIPGFLVSELILILLWFGNENLGAGSQETMKKFIQKPKNQDRAGLILGFMVSCSLSRS